jgi:hypothetical protein
LGLAIHETARASLLADLLRRNPTRFFAYHRRAMEELLRLRRQGHGPKKEEYGWQLLSLCADVCGALTYPGRQKPATWQMLPDVGPLQPAEASEIAAIFARKRGHVGHTGSAFEELRRFVSRVAQELPDMVRVVRSATGGLLGFSLSFTLSPNTLSMLPMREQYAVLEALGPDSETEMATKAIRLMAAGWIVTEDPDLPPPILWTALLIDWLLTLGEGRLGLALGYEFETEAYFARLGFKPRRMTAGAPKREGDEVGVFALDFRDRGLDDWVFHLLQQSYPFSIQRRTAVVSADSVREALKWVNSPARLAASALAEQNQWSGEFLVDQLVGMISGTIDTDLTLEHKRLLDVTFVHAAPHYTHALESLHMSRSSYYRHLGEAIERLILALRQLPSEDPAPYS